MKDCLEEHRDDAEFSSECKEEFEKMMETRAADYRLDSSLREKCADDIEDLCGFQKVNALLTPPDILLLWQHALHVLQRQLDSQYQWRYVNICARHKTLNRCH